MVLIHRLDEFRAKIKAKKANCTYDQLEEAYGINRWYFWQLINDDSYTPPEQVQTALGIQTFKPAPVCSVCGEVHTTSRCTKKKRKYKDLFSMPAEVLRYQIENREEFR